MMMVGRRVRHLGPIAPITTTTTTTAAATTTPTTSALLKESRQLLLKQQLKLQLNINVSEMMDNLRRNVDDEYNFTQKFDGDLSQNLARVHEVEEEASRGAPPAAARAEARREAGTGTAAEDGQNKLDTVTTVPQLQQKFNQFNIIEAATSAATTTTTSSLRVAEVTTTATATTTLSSSSSITTFTTTTTAATTYTSLTQKQPQNTALAKFNRIIDNTVPVISHYQHQQQQQQHVADTFTRTSQQHQQPTSSLEMPMLSDSLKRRLASHPYYQTDLIVNNSKMISSSDRTGTAEAAAGSHLPSLISSQMQQQQQQQKPKREEEMKQVFVEDDQLKRNDVHYLLKQLNSFSDIEEIEIVDMKQKQRLQQQLIRDKQQQHHHHHQQQPQQQLSQPQYAEDQQNLHKITESTIFSYDSRHMSQQHNVDTRQDAEYVATMGQHVSESLRHMEHVAHADISSHQVTDVSQLAQHVTSLPLYVSSYSQHISGVTQQHVATDHLRQFVHLPPPLYADSVRQPQHMADNDDDDGAKESKQHFQATSSASSPTATSLVIYSPSSQSHKGIRRYASLHHQDDDSSEHYQHHLQHHHHHPHTHCRYHTHHQAPHGHPPHHPLHAHHPHMPHEHYSEGSILDSAAARAAACDPLALQQFVDDYIFQSCHYLETNNFAANYCTAMVESSSHEFRPSTTTTTRTSNEEYDDEECYVEDHSSAHSFELHECEPPTVICKAPAPAPLRDQQAPQHIRASMRHLAPLSSPPPHYTMETRLCSSGVQTDLTASSLAQSFSLSSSLSSTEQRKRRQPIFKCCYTPLDRWREKRHHQQQQQHKLQQEEQQQQQQQQQQHQLQLTKKRTKTVTTQREQQSSSSRTTTTSCLKNTTVAVVGSDADAGGAGGVNIIAPLGGGVGGVSSMRGGGLIVQHAATTSLTATSTSASLVVHSQHHSLSTKNAPYAV